ncbi:MAG: iron chelate uptake ABC transporter family permease subunit, partial [Candidatus Omnitrophica bacterium]|nr:iron chelate uptake ABC transporter family permease subunit [Candidatus Omnitrophota bacterium]
MNKKNINLGQGILILMIALAATVLASMMVGAAAVSFSELVAVFRRTEVDPSVRSILLTLRLPRIVLGFAVGSALSVAGVILQGMFRNPLVEPYTLGISGGAALGVCATLVFQLHRSVGIIAIPVSGFLGAVCIVGIVYLLGSHKGFLNMNGLLLSGVMISFICSSLFMLIMAVMRVEDLHGIVFWNMGSLAQPSWLLISIMAGVSLFG